MHDAKMRRIRTSIPWSKGPQDQQDSQMPKPQANQAEGMGATADLWARKMPSMPGHTHTHTAYQCCPSAFRHLGG